MTGHHEHGHAHLAARRYAKGVVTDWRSQARSNGLPLSVEECDVIGALATAAFQAGADYELETLEAALQEAKRTS